MAEFSRLSLFLATSCFIAFLGFLTWKQPSRPGKRYFALVIGIWFVWSLATIVEFTTRSETIRFLAAQMQIFCGQLTAPFELAFSLEYIGRRRWLSWQRMALIFLPVLIIQAISVTNPLHHLFWTEFRFGSAAILTRQPLAWIVMGYSMALWVANMVVLITGLLRVPAFSTPILLLILGQAVPRFAFLTASPLLTDLSPLHLALLTSNFTGITYFLGVFTFGMLRVYPIARDTALETMMYGVIVLDVENWVIDLNPAARKLIGLSKTTPFRQGPGALLGDWWPRIAPLIGDQPALQELAVDSAAGRRVFELHVLPLYHETSWLMGHVVVVNDITAAWRARQQLAQQQWAQATLEEREQLAEELHDGLSQNLAFLNMQAQTTQVYLQTGQNEEVRSSLNRLSEVLSQMQGDTREMISNLMIVSRPAASFVTTLRQTLANFEKQTGLQTRVEADKEAEAACSAEILGPAVSVQLLRIVQEALANVRKHAQRSRQITVRLTLEKQMIRVTIADDGAGFDPSGVKNSEDGHFGLHIMHQRAARIGAQLTIQSEVGRGTRVEVVVPICGARDANENSFGR